MDATTPIVTGIPHNDAAGGRHSGCRPRFAPGTSELFVGTGDAAFHAHPQDTASLAGKVLRVDRDGNGLAGNPGVDSPGIFDPRVFTRGHRNVQGIGFRPGSNQPFSAEHGPSVDDELNRLSSGANYGWRPLPTYNEGVPMTDHSLATCPCTDATRSSEDPTVAPSGMTFLHGAQWKGWDGAVILVLLKNAALGQRARLLSLNAAGTSTTAMTDILVEGVRLRSAVQGPDGNLYVSTDSGQVWKLTPS